MEVVRAVAGPAIGLALEQEDRYREQELDRIRQDLTRERLRAYAEDLERIELEAIERELNTETLAGMTTEELRAWTRDRLEAANQAQRDHVFERLERARGRLAELERISRLPPSLAREELHRLAQVHNSGFSYSFGGSRAAAPPRARKVRSSKKTPAAESQPPAEPAVSGGNLHGMGAGVRALRAPGAVGLGHGL